MTIPDFIRPHHARAIEEVVAYFEGDAEIRALLIAGSVAKNLARDESDIDAMLIVSPERWACEQEAGRVTFIPRGLATSYPGGYADCKILDETFLRAVGERGGEPARNAFVDAFFGFCRDEELFALVERAAHYPEAERQSKIESFHAQVLLNRGYFWTQATGRNDPCLLHRTASDLVLFGSRMILAWNRMFFPSHKRLLETLDRAPDKPENISALARELLLQPTTGAMNAWCEAILGFAPWNVETSAGSTFVRDTELGWLFGTPSISDN